MRQAGTSPVATVWRAWAPRVGALILLAAIWLPGGQTLAAGELSDAIADPGPARSGTQATFTKALAVSNGSLPTGGLPTARGDTYATPIGKTLTVQHSRVSGVLYNDFDTDAGANDIGNAGLTAMLVSGPAQGSLTYLNANGSFEYVPGPALSDNDNDSFTYQAVDLDGNRSNVATVNIHVLSDQPDFKIMMNYELGMHCTGFEFSYCCILPPYNSIVAQVVKPQTPGEPQSGADFARLLEADPDNGLDALGRETVLRDVDADGNIHKYYLEYFHDAQPRREGNVHTNLQQKGTLISDVEGNSLLYHDTPYDSAAVDAKGALARGTYNGVDNVVVGDGDYLDPTDNFANGWLNHLYIYDDLEGSNPNHSSLEADKIRLGVTGHIEYPGNVGAGLQPVGPISDGQPSKDAVGFDNVLTFSGNQGTLVYTKARVLENVPIMLTSPRLWEALGLPLTPFEDSIDFFAEPGAVDEDAIRPFVAMKARLHTASCNEVTGDCTKGPAVIGSNGRPVIGFGAAPIDIPNCERCHSAPAYERDASGNFILDKPNVNSPSYLREGEDFYGYSLQQITDLETNYWKSIYPSLTTGSDWYARLKGAAVNMLAMHDMDTGTSFLANYPASGDLLGLPVDKQIAQNTRMGHESVICQKCHGDNVIAALDPLGEYRRDPPIPPISEAIHDAHRAKSAGGVIELGDSFGRFGGCQGCHPAHRSDGVMDRYPITKGGANANANGDNRLGGGGCYVGRDVHSNPLKDVDGAETPEHLNAVGTWLAVNVGADTGSWRGIWCTNCHNQLSQEMWRTENCKDLVHGECEVSPRTEGSLEKVANAVGFTLAQAEMWLDPKDPAVSPTLPSGAPRTADLTHAVWNGAIPDADAAIIEMNAGGTCAVTPWNHWHPDSTACFALDGDGDPSVRILQSLCTTDDCLAAAQASLDAEGNGSTASRVSISAFTDGRDHWLAAGEPHCADCHAAPYVEQSGNITAFLPFNFPRKASLSRYTRGHQGISCQGCHESIHGLYPVGPAMDNTSYAQAAALNYDGSHGPLKCGTCHSVDETGIPTWIRSEGAVGSGIGGFDDAVTWAHSYTDELDVRTSTCQNCHADDSADIGARQKTYLEHSQSGYTSRAMMDKAEIAQLDHVLGAQPGPERDSLCSTCHRGGRNKLGDVTCNKKWRQHLSQGQVAESVWEEVSRSETGTLCGW